MKIRSKAGVDYNVEVNGSLNPNGENYVICPICTPSREEKHKRERKLAINFGYKPRKWRCNHCKEAGVILDDIMAQTSVIKPLDNYKVGDDLTDNFASWLMRERSLSRETAAHFNLSLSVEVLLQNKVREEENHMQGKFVARKCINFPYFYNDQLINIKFRDENKNFKLMKGASIIMYNIDAIREFDWCVIVEGEFDVLAFYEAGIAPVISVPNGVAISDKERNIITRTGIPLITSPTNLEYLDSVIECFDNKKLIIIATDDDPPGIKLREELARRLGKERCRFIRFSKWHCKDANDVLIKYDKITLTDTINHAEVYPVEGVSRVSDHWEENKKEFEEGKKMGITTGYRSLDPHLRWMPGWLYIINGHPSQGKTTFLLNLVVISSVIHNFKWGIYSPENYPPKNIIDTMAEIYVGKTSSLEWKNRMSIEEYKAAIINHLDKHIFIVDNENGYTPAELLGIKKRMVRQYGIHGFITDPWKNLKHSMGNMTIDDYIREQLNQEVRMSTHEKIINVICHHPRTPVLDKDKKPRKPSPFELTGGVVWMQSGYMMVTIHRQDPFTKGNDLVEIHVDKIKEKKLIGETTEAYGPVLLRYEHKSGRFLEKMEINKIDSSLTRFPLDDNKLVIQNLIEGF